MTDTYKVLGQVESVAGSILPFYTTPAGKQAVSSSLSIVNTGEAGTDYSVFAVPASEYSSVFVETQEGWSQAGATLLAEAIFDYFGYSVSLSADGLRLAVGAWQNDNSNGDNSGHVRVYDWSDSNWVQVGADIDGEALGVFSGYSVSLSADGSRVAIGGVQDNVGNARGHVRVYQWNGFAWFQVGGGINGESDYDQSGYSVSISADGSRVAIGAPFNSSFRPEAGATIVQGGHVRVYELFGGSGGSWVQVGPDIDGEWFYNRSGWSVSLSADGSRVAIGAPENDGNDTDSGHVRVYSWNGTDAWVQLGGDIDGEVASDRSGSSVSLSADGARLAIGARYNSGVGYYAGHVRIYDWNGFTWNQVGSDIDGENANDEFGSSVSLSADGMRVAIASSAAGHVRVYDWNDSNWVQVGADIDSSGGSISISANGSRVAIGASNTSLVDGVWVGGLVRVYDFNEYQSEIVPQSKHALIRSKAISAGVHDEIVGGIQLSAGDAVLVSSPSGNVVFNMYGVETL